MNEESTHFNRKTGEKMKPKEKKEKLLIEEPYLLEIALIMNRELWDEQKISYEAYKYAEESLNQRIKKRKK